MSKEKIKKKLEPIVKWSKYFSAPPFHMLVKLCSSIFVPIVPNRIIFDSFGGLSYSDSPKAICEVLLKNNLDLDLVWICKDDNAVKSLPEGVRAVPLRGLKKYKALTSAGIWVGNCRRYEKVKRKKQFYLQTWHGFALKKVEQDAKNLEKDYLRACKNDSKQCDLFISGSKFMTQLYKNRFWYKGDVLEVGTPRNDIFYWQKNEREKIRANVCKAFGVPEDRKLVLYAPTFREDGSTDAYGLDVDMVRRKCKETVGGEWTVLVRLHHKVSEKSEKLFSYDGDRILNATYYPDMQELLCAAELLITDYSSCMFDYALTGKRIALFATDIAAYKEDRNFYYPIETWPFPLAQSNEELDTILSNLQPLQNSSEWAEFARNVDFCEDGQAAVRCAAIILQQMKNK